MDAKVQECVDGILSGNIRLAARAITMIESRDPIAKKIVEGVFPHGGKVPVIGITGPPGVGKSTLVNSMVSLCREKKQRIGVLAVDPSSPFTGGAILGDRVRMSSHFTDENVFIRSMASRNSLGGLAYATRSALYVMEAMPLDIIFVETIGVGQGEVDIMKTADIVILVQEPGAGDDIQAVKAGILEIGDIFVVNKADRDGAEKTVSELKEMIDFHYEEKDLVWVPPILKAEALREVGIKELLEEIHKYQLFMENNIEIKLSIEKRKIQSILLEICKEIAAEKLFENIETQFDENVINLILDRKKDPYSISSDVMNL